MANEQDLTPLLETQQAHAGHLMDVSNGIDTKALAFLAINIALIIFVAQSAVTPHGMLQSLLLYGPFVASTIFNGLAFWPRYYASAGVDLVMYPDYLTMDSATLVRQLLADIELVIEDNTRLNAIRLRFCIISIITSVAGLGILLIFAILKA
jgi:hypothetical protein